MNQDWKRVTKQSYNDHAQDFVTYSFQYRGKLKQWIEDFTSQFSIGDKIIDIGCGSGRDAKYFTNHNLSVVGIDFSEELLRYARKLNPAAEFHVMDFEQLSFPQDSFSGAWASASLVHIPKKNLLPLLIKIYKTLKENGYFFGTFRIGKEEKLTEEKRGNGVLTRFYSYYKQRELVQIFKQAGFKKIKCELDTIESGDWIGISARK